MRIGIKYCGGCNPRYSRLQLVDKLIKDFNAVSFEIAKESEFYDILLVICGCFSACANHNKYIGKQKIIVTEMNDINRLVEVLKP